MNKNPQWYLPELCQEVRCRAPEGAANPRSPAELARLRSLLKSLPADDESLMGAEGAAIYHEATGNLPAALLARRLHVERLDRLHREIRRDGYDAETRETLLEGCDESAVRCSVLATQRLERLLLGGRIGTQAA